MVISAEQLTEVRKGQIGMGLLIEHDGHIKMNSDVISQIKEDIRNNDRFTIPDKLTVSALFQKYGVKNANGRIYSENILKREVEKYKINITNHNAVGSLDHPSCQLDDTQILTKEGWKNITDVVNGEDILTITPDKKIETHPVLRKIAEKYIGKLIHLEGKPIDIKVTPNHKFPIFDKHKDFIGFYSAQDVFLRLIPNQDYCSFIKCRVWDNYGDEYPVIDKVTEEEANYISLNNEDLSITEEDYNGMVYCVEVKNHTFYTMCPNGECLWSGNSSTISGHDISHNITNLYWEGNTLLGEMELHLSPGYTRYGICSTSGDLVANMLLSGYRIGVSSRGVGSVEQKLGNYIVGDDYELICWDVVIEPSTPGAYIAQTTKELNKYIESEAINTKDSSIIDRINAINKILMP